MARPPRLAIQLPDAIKEKLDEVLEIYGGRKTTRCITAIEEYCDRKLAENRKTKAEKLLLGRKGESEC